jgi:DNA-binding NarL/FixJ family response regulator
MDEPRRLAISRNLGDIVLFALYFHELFMKSVVRLGIQSRFIGRPLSYRERECLTLAARGLTTEDIGYKLGICTRTVQFHFDSIRSKLAVAKPPRGSCAGDKDGQISI